MMFSPERPRHHSARPPACFAVTLISHCDIIDFDTSTPPPGMGVPLAFRFGDIVLDGTQRELRSGTTLVPIEPQVFDLLEFLIRNRDRVVSKDDLVASVWRGRVVSDSAIAARINAARRAVGDDGEQQRWIRTIAGKGFRFVGDVLEEEGTTKLPSGTAAPAQQVTQAPRTPEITFCRTSDGVNLAV